MFSVVPLRSLTFIVCSVANIGGAITVKKMNRVYNGTDTSFPVTLTHKVLYNMEQHACPAWNTPSCFYSLDSWFDSTQVWRAGSKLTLNSCWTLGSGAWGTCLIFFSISLASDTCFLLQLLIQTGKLALLAMVMHRIVYTRNFNF